MTGKLNLSFRLGRDTIAGCGPVPPAANGSQYVAIGFRTGALQNQRAVHAAIGPDNKADLHPVDVLARYQERVRRGQPLWRPDLLAASTEVEAGNLPELNVTFDRLPPGQLMRRCGDADRRWRHARRERFRRQGY